MIPMVIQNRARVPMKTNHVLISGTGRSGTTFITQILTLLDIETGFNHLTKDQLLGHGDKMPDHLELYMNWDILKYSKSKRNVIQNFPEVFKSPQAIEFIPKILRYINLKHVIIPMRNLEDVNKSAKQQNLSEGLFEIDHMREILLHGLYNLTKYNTPFTTLHFPTLVRDANYLYDKLNPIFPKINFDSFNHYFKQLTNKEK